MAARADTVDYNLNINSPSSPNNPGLPNPGFSVANTLDAPTTWVAPSLNGYDRSSQSWSSGTWSVGSPDATNRSGKNKGGGETGLSLVADPIGEYEDSSNGANYGFLVLNVTAFKSDPNLEYFELQIGSAQSGELYKIWSSNSATCTLTGGCGSLGPATLLTAGTEVASAGPFNVTGWLSYSYLWLGTGIAPGGCNS